MTDTTSNMIEGSTSSTTSELTADSTFELTEVSTSELTEVSTSELTEVSTSELTEGSTPGLEPIEDMPPITLMPGDTVTELRLFDNIKPHSGKGKEYTIRIALIDSSVEKEKTKKACYFDAVDLESNTIVAHKRIPGAATISYNIGEDSSFMSISVTSFTYEIESNHDPEIFRIKVISSNYTFSLMSALGVVGDPKFVVYDGSKQYNGSGIVDSPAHIAAIATENFVQSLIIKLDNDNDQKFAYLMSNDEAFHAYCGTAEKSVLRFKWMWDDYKSIRPIMEFYGFWKPKN